MSAALKRCVICCAHHTRTGGAKYCLRCMRLVAAENRRLNNLHEPDANIRAIENVKNVLKSMYEKRTPGSFYGD